VSKGKRLEWFDQETSILLPLIEKRNKELNKYQDKGSKLELKVARKQLKKAIVTAKKGMVV